MDHNSYFFDSQYQDENFCGENQYSQYSENENVCEIENQNEIDGDALLISLVRDYPYIYNKELTDFKDTFKKQNAWTEIASILNMTVDECQSRWTRLRERYTREKKQRQEETTTGSGASKRKTFEFFNNMQFLDPFVKKRRTMINVQHAKSSPLTKRCISLQKNFNFSNEKENLFLANVVTLQQNFSKVNNAELLEQNRFTSLSGRNVNVSPTNTTTLLEQQQSFTEINQAKINQRDSTSLSHKSSDAVTSCQSDASSISVLSASDYARKKGLSSQIKSKGKSQSDVVNAISKVTSLLENKYSSKTASTVSSSLKPKVEEDVAFCQLMLSLLIKMQQCKNTEKKGNIAHYIRYVE
ncbi:uncharacterized protein [Linepithema humile]|uniref:uncharacterized protein n=1 Tax=Linepithema humile TaxID=83485 RepID=UPI00351EC869